ncbi:MAG: hypothetical protein ACO3AA_08075 [Chitinophagaceae bacterium]
MKFQEGDKVIVVATGEKGVIVEWINKTMLTIDVGGVQFPVYADQIDFPYFDEFSKKKNNSTKKSTTSNIPRQEKKLVKHIPRDGVHIAFFPILDKDEFDDDLFSHYRVFILNHTDDSIILHFSVKYNDQKEHDTKHLLNALDDLYLFDLPFDRLNDHPKFIFDFSLEKASKDKASRYVVEFKPKSKQFLLLSEKTLKDHNASFKFLLMDKYPGKEAEVKLEADENSQQFDNDKGEIDLSILQKAGFKVNKKN